MKNLKDVLSNKFKNDKVVPAAGGFEAVFNAVNKLKKKKRIRFILLYSSIAALFILGGSWAIINSNFTQKNKTQTHEITKMDNTKGEEKLLQNPKVTKIALNQENANKSNKVKGENDVLTHNNKPLYQDKNGNRREFSNRALTNNAGAKEKSSSLNYSFPTAKSSEKGDVNGEKFNEFKGNEFLNSSTNTNQLDKVNTDENMADVAMADFIMILDPTKKVTKINHAEKEIGKIRNRKIDNPLIKWTKKDAKNNKYFGEFELELLTGLTDRKLLRPLATQLADNTFNLSNIKTFGYGLNLKYLYKIGSYSAVYTGIGFMKSTQQATLNNKYTEHKTEYSTRTAVVYDPGLGRNKTIEIHDTTEKTINHNTQNNYTNSFAVLSIPIGYEHRIPLKKNIFVVRMGTAINIYQNNTYYSRAEGSNIPIENNETTGVLIQGLNLGAGVLRPIGKGYYLKAELDYRNSFKLNPAMYNVGLGVRKVF